MIKAVVKSIIEFDKWASAINRSMQNIGAQTGGIVAGSEGWLEITTQVRQNMTAYETDLFATTDEVNNIATAFGRAGISQEQAFLRGGKELKGLVGSALELNSACLSVFIATN